MQEIVRPQVAARLAGGLYLTAIAASVFAELAVRDTLIVTGDAAATAANIRASEPLFRLGFAADLVSALCYFTLTFLLFQLLRPVNRRIALFSAFLGSAGSAIMALNLQHLLAPLGGIPAELGPALTQVSLRLHSLGYTIASIFFSAHLLVLGSLIVRSAFLPRLLGVLLAIAAVSGAINGFTIFLAPAAAAGLYPYILLPNLIAEGGLALWLLVAGVNVDRWHGGGR
ncbi:MAG TPA: DUF4386 domain-containing protein [Allosphingosinicella sp.]|jgi:hypothetical protein|nr:DUF4386 domain-containing protein [Allosphingosinicella sp.]